METATKGLSRRGFLGYGAAGLATVVAGGSGLLRWAAPAGAKPVALSLFANEGVQTMIDGRQLYLLGFGTTAGAVNVPATPIEVVQGDQVTLTLTNNLRVPHNFAIAGVVDTGLVAPGASTTVAFTAPAPGTYLFADTSAGGMFRALGLHGAMVVMPVGITNRSRPGGLVFTKQFSWVFNEIQEEVSATAQAGGAFDMNAFVPDYFTINGVSGVLSSKDDRIAPHTKLGQPFLVRMTNAGRAARSIHFHGNHFVIVAHPDPWLVGAEKDTVRVPAGQAVEVWIPAMAPRDALPRVTKGQKYPVHDHVEMTQTANGGFYPSGMVTDWVLE